MAYKNLISPEFRLDLGKYILEDGIMVEYVSSADDHADWARINLDEYFQSPDNWSDRFSPGE